MLSLKFALPYVLLLASSAKISAFNADECDVFVFRTQEDALWHCGAKLPGESGNPDESLYCDHSLDGNTYPFAWASDHPDDWCNFMVSTVRQENEDHYPLTPDININDTPGPNKWFFSTLVDWGCYMVENDQVVASYLVDSKNGQHASTTTQQCERKMNYFDYWNLNAAIRDEKWTGAVPETSYEPHRTQWGRCHYDDVEISSNYAPELGVQYAECPAGWICELKYTDYASCMPDPHVDHECCISWNNKCENEGDCCVGSECNADGFCEVGLAQKFDDPPGICQSRGLKDEKKYNSRCHDYASGGQGDCAPGYLCQGNWWYAQCVIDPSVKNECCKWEWDDTSPRPGDCCVGWYAHCHAYDPNTGECIDSQCIPGRETGVDENGNSMLDVHDRICTDVPVLASFNEQIDQCVGAVCGVWGDPHIITCDDLHYDCQAVGLFTIMKNHMFNVQANFVRIDTPWGGFSNTNDIIIDYIKDDPNGIPTVQFSFPSFESVDPDNQIYDPKSKKIGSCPVLMYIDGELIDISAVDSQGFLYGDENSDFYAKRNGYNQIDVQHLAGYDDHSGAPYYSSSTILVEGSGPFTEWSCLFTYFICLPRAEEADFKTSSVGLLGTPTGTTKDDWMGPDGQTLLLPTHDQNQASYDYCLDNWCVAEDESIMVYPPGVTYEDVKCEDDDPDPFDPDDCDDIDRIIEECKGSPQPLTCQMEKCIGNPNVDDFIGDDDCDNFVDDDDNTDDEYDDCTDLGSGLSGATGEGTWSLHFPSIDNIHANGGFSVGYDNSVSVLVGGSFTCIQGAGFEGRGVFLGDMNLLEEGCERMAATAHGSLIHPVENKVCVEVGGSVNIESSFPNSKYIMYEYGNSLKSCHMVYKGDCTVNGDECGSNLSELEQQFIFTNGDVTQDSAMNLTHWSDQITLLQQKASYWKTLAANGVTEVIESSLIMKAGPDNNPVQIFTINPIDSSINFIVFTKELIGKTILIQVEGDGDFNVPNFCFQPADAIPTDDFICGHDTFPTDLTGSIAWVFQSQGSLALAGNYEFQGSIVKPWGDLTVSMVGHSGRLIVGGDLTVDGEYTELHNYEFDPVSHPLPLGDDVDAVCEIEPPTTCVESYKTLTSETACPSKPEGIVSLIKSSAEFPEDEPILYDIIVEEPSDSNSAHTVKFKVDNPFANHTDIFIKHVKKVGDYAMDPVCESMPFTAGCSLEAPTIEVGCHEYDGVEPFALVNIYFASNTDSVVMDIGSGGDVTVDKCCKPPEEYGAGYGVIEYTFEIQCSCPDGVTEA